MINYNIITLFPELIENYCAASILGRAQKNKLVQVSTINPREFTKDFHRSVDDTPYGGGSGMVLMCKPLFDAYESIEKLPNSLSILTTPQGTPLNQALVKELSTYDQLIILCGHYEGVDERVKIGLNLVEISIGDYVLTGGELAAMCIIDSTARLVKGVLGKTDSTIEESFNNGLLEYPHYTKPATFRNMDVPEVLLSGHHKNIEIWRRQQSLIKTLNCRPDLLKKISLNNDDRAFLNNYSNNRKEI